MDSDEEEVVAQVAKMAGAVGRITHFGRDSGGGYTEPRQAHRHLGVEVETSSAPDAPHGFDRGEDRVDAQAEK